MVAARIPRIAGTAQFFDELYCNELPVVITGLARAWPSAGWTGEFVKTLVGTRGQAPLRGAAKDDYRLETLFPDPGAYSFSSVVSCDTPTTQPTCGFAWTNNFVGVIRGARAVTLLPPRSEQVMAVSPALRAKLAAGEAVVIDGEAYRALSAHPMFADCPHVLEETLTDGDVVFFPAYWFHCFRELGESISVTTQTLAYDG